MSQLGLEVLACGNPRGTLGAEGVDSEVQFATRFLQSTAIAGSGIETLLQIGTRGFEAPAFAGPPLFVSPPRLMGLAKLELEVLAGCGPRRTLGAGGLVRIVEFAPGVVDGCLQFGARRIVAALRVCALGGGSFELGDPRLQVARARLVRATRLLGAPLRLAEAGLEVIAACVPLGALCGPSRLACESSACEARSAVSISARPRAAVSRSMAARSSI